MLKKEVVTDEKPVGDPGYSEHFTRGCDSLIAEIGETLRDKPIHRDCHGKVTLFADFELQCPAQQCNVLY